MYLLKHTHEPATSFKNQNIINNLPLPLCSPRFTLLLPSVSHPEEFIHPVHAHLLPFPLPVCPPGFQKQPEEAWDPHREAWKPHTQGEVDGKKGP